MQQGQFNMKALPIIGAASGLGAADPGCADGPPVMMRSTTLQKLNNRALPLRWQHTVSLPSTDDLLSMQDKMPLIAKWAEEISYYVSEHVEHHEPFIVIGGDHSCAIGTWSGARAALAAEANLGLIWIDAHLDSHTPATSETNNIHGMPVAALLGYGAPELTQIRGAHAKIKPENLCFIGVRSYESGEMELIKRLNVRVYFMEEVLRRGIASVLKEAKAAIEKNVAHWGLSIDLDAIDPQDAPGVGSPEPHGLNANELCAALTQFQGDARLTGVEIAEYNPHRDIEGRTEHLICRLLEAIY